ncbi:MerR family DNA-binding transcriptional regulator [Actinoplanes sp. LDG1-06]|uniref:MerR family DNA-binding transcriptional regulator n=1 Tax=Paractinoplanes ovalisporus TaxID=2810368 RepID=A0ABS2AFL4_9ACTN|nr:MerR family transcriptional regulator [Actinoplanes ovalisporus]MBM2618617.1 MerR family DNA-binding transcriptional regulator [Actinoplanes ovalisporus]
MRIKLGWSTRELAELAGTSLKTVRHYHRIGLLEEPERAPNGYKNYRIPHLIRLLRIRRLVDLGVSLADIAVIEESDEGADQVFRALDAELKASIERQQRMREELAAILQHRKLADLPPGFGQAAAELSDTDRAFLLLSERIFEPQMMDTLREIHDTPPSAEAREFTALTDDATDEQRRSLAERYAPEIRRERDRYPDLTHLAREGAAGKGDQRMWSVVLQGIAEMHNAAQIDVLQRVNDIIDHEDGPAGAGDHRR